MCRAILNSAFLISLLFLMQTVYGQIIAWDVNGQPGNQEIFGATTISDYLEPSFLVRGDGLNPNSLLNSFNSSSFSADTSFETAVENDEYIQFTIQARSGFTVSLTTLDATFRRSGTGPFLFRWLYSLDGFATDGINIGDVIEYVGTETNGMHIDQINLSSISHFQNVGSETVITVRLYGWGASSGGGTFAIGRLTGDNLAVGGTVTMDIGTDGPIILHTPPVTVTSTADQNVTALIVGDELTTGGDNRPALWYRADAGGWENTYYTTADGDIYEFTLPGRDYGSYVEYYFAAEDKNDVRTSPEGGSGTDPVGINPPATYYSYTVEDVSVDGLVFYFTTDPNDVSEEKRVYYPFAGMGSEEGDVRFYGDDDWTYIDPMFPFYLVVRGEEELIAAEFFVNWDPESGDVDISMGNLFIGDDSNHISEVVEPGRMRVSAFSLEGNVTPDPGEYLATVEVTATRPGHHLLTIDDISLRYYDEEEDRQVGVPGASFPGEIRFYPGDFAHRDNGMFSGARGDGMIDYADLMMFAGAYWSERGDAGYLTKYDIGPTDSDGSYFRMPAADGIIDFEDLVMFAIGYYKSAEDHLPKQMTEPLRIIVHAAEAEADGLVSLPLGIEGNVYDLRALSIDLTFPEAALRYDRISAAGELDRDLGFIAARACNGILTVDAAIIGRNSTPFSREGVFAYVYFEKEDAIDISSIDIVSVKARDSYNRDIPVAMLYNADYVQPAKPSRFGITQNYPNPFNPGTTIAYQLPEDVHVDIVVYNILGKEVIRLVNEFHESGFYSVEWNGLDRYRLPVPSGLYFYRMQAGDYIETRRMLMLK